MGKRIKASKVKVMWQLALAVDFVVHQIELKHSIVTGKHEISLDGKVLMQNKSRFTKGMCVCVEHCSVLVV